MDIIHRSSLRYPKSKSIQPKIVHLSFNVMSLAVLWLFKRWAMFGQTFFGFLYEFCFSVTYVQTSGWTSFFDWWKGSFSKTLLFIDMTSKHHFAHSYLFLRISFQKKVKAFDFFTSKMINQSKILHKSRRCPDINAKSKS